MEREEGRKKYKSDKGQEEILDIYLNPRNTPKKLVLCLAAPGTGKTTTIVRLLLELIKLGTRSPIQNFIVLTFTKRTRNDILKKFQDEGRNDLIQKLGRIVRSFHSLAFTSLFWDDIITDTDISNHIKDVATSAGVNTQGYDGLKIRKILKILKEAISQDKIEETIRQLDENNPTYARFVKECVDWLEANYADSKSISYDYALIKFIKNLKQGRNPFRIDLSKIQLLIVDQFQDSNPAQMKIVECILERNPKMRLLMTGDIDQTIYTWRGTDLVQLDNFISSYEEQGQYRRVLLENTHRLGSQVVKVSQQLIRSRPAYLQFRHKYYGDYRPKPLNVDHDHAPVVMEFQSEFSQVNWVIKKIKRLVDAKIGINYKDITVLLRSFKFTQFFNKFKFENTRLAQMNNTQQIPFAVKSDQNNQNIQSILAWLVYFHKKQYFRRDSVKEQIRIILKHMKATKKTMENIIDHNSIDLIHVSRRGWNNEKDEKWMKFFIDFRAVERIMKEGQTFNQVFEAVYNQLIQEKRCIEMSEHQRSQFLQYVSILEAHLIRRQRLQNKRLFAIICEIIQSNVYDLKKEKAKEKAKQKKKAKKQQKDGKQMSIRSFLRPPQKSNKQQSPQKRQAIRQSDQSRRQLKQERDLHYESIEDKVHFQTVYKAKGLQFKVVFICSLNFDYKHEEYQPCAFPRNTQEANRNDAEREMHRARDLSRHIVKEQEQLRVIYTALTRTSRYSFITASEKDCFVPDFSVKHPHFEYLQGHCKESSYVPLQDEEDKVFKEAYLRHIESQRTTANDGRTRRRRNNAGQTTLQMHI